MSPIDFRDLACDILEASKCAFGEKVRYKPSGPGQAWIEIRGIYSDVYESVDPDTETVVSSNRHHLGVKLKDLPKPPEKGDFVEVRGKQFRVIDSQEDGYGGSHMFLHERGARR